MSIEVGNLSIKLDEDEKIFYIPQKEKNYFIFSFIVLVLFFVGLVFVAVYTKNFDRFFLSFVVFFAIILLVYYSYKSETAILTNKRIMVVKGKNLEYIDFKNIKNIKGSRAKLKIKTVTKSYKIGYINGKVFIEKLGYIYKKDIPAEDSTTRQKKIMIMLMGIMFILTGLPSILQYLLVTRPNNQKNISKESIKVDTNYTTKQIGKYKQEATSQYMKTMERMVKAKWSPPALASSAKVTVSFTVIKDGKIFNLKIKQSSGNFELDKSALKAVETAGELPKIPSAIGTDALNIDYTFNYNRNENKNAK